LTDEDGVADCFTGYVAALADIHNALEDLRDTIETLDSLKSPIAGSFTDVDDLLTNLRH
jgi:hypothetical protein